MQVKQITLNNGEMLAYREYGWGEQILVMLHGNLCGGIHFEPFSHYFDSSRYRLLVPDLRGFGDSSYQNPIVQIGDFADDLEDFLQQLGIEGFSLLGWSAGGCVCMDYAQRYPSRASHLILVASVGINGCPMYDENGKQYDSIEKIATEQTQVAPALKAIQTQDQLFMRQLWNTVIYIHEKPTAAAFARQIRASLQQRNLPEMYLALSNFNMVADCQVDIPVMVVWGREDPIILQEDAALTANILKAQRFFKVAHSGHCPFVDCPIWLAEQIRSFMAL